MIEGWRGVRQSMNQGLRTSVLAGLLLAASVSHAAIPDGTVDPAHIKYAGRASAAVPALRSSAAFVLDTTHSSVLYSRRSDVAVPIASITKLMTALVVLEAAQPLDELIEVTAEDRGHGSSVDHARASGLTAIARASHSLLLGAATCILAAATRSGPRLPRALAAAPPG